MRTQPNLQLRWQSRPGAEASDRGSIAQQRRRVCLGAAALFGLVACTTAPVRVPAPAAGRVVPFSTSRRLGELPDGWHEQVVRRDLPRTSYAVVQRDDRRVLQAVSDGGASGLRCDVDVDPLATPWLDWTWRVDRVDVNATVAADELDDSPARMMVAFDGDFSRLPLRDQMFRDMVEGMTGQAMPFATLVYVWDGKAPPESVFRSPRSDRIRYLVVASGERDARRWLSHRRNVAQDYRRIFGGEPGRVRNVGVMTDSDDLKTPLETWYADIDFS
ncbi:MAG: DUF3047 domain-containing protein [Ideonella sp.]|nr:DUF3047 domain-containing protein [Ideonella sp.]